MSTPPRTRSPHAKQTFPKASTPGESSLPPQGSEQEAADIDDAPSVLFALGAGSISVVLGFSLVDILARKTTATLAPWVIARGTGLALVVVTTALVSVGLWIAHPMRNKTKGIFHAITLNSAHKSLAGAGMVLLFLHISAIASDSFAKVGVLGAFVPLESQYRPIPVALGTLALYLMTVVGFTAWLKVRFKLFNWKMVHRYAIISFALVMIHGITVGTDTVAVGALYLGSAVMVTALAITRYMSDHPKSAPKVTRDLPSTSSNTSADTASPKA